MDSLERFKLAIQNEEFKNKFSSAKNVDEALKIAKSNGYDLNKGEVLRDNELMDDMMDTVAGGKGDADTEVVTHSTIVSGDNSHAYTSPETAM